MPTPQPRFRCAPLEDRTAPAAVVVPDDPSYPDQYALGKIAAPAAWAASTGTGATVVAVVDSGIDPTHPDLSGNLWTNPGEVAGNGADDDHDGYADDVHGWDFVGNDGDPNDGDGHGTHVAGIIGAAGDNGRGVAGVDWHARLMPLRILDQTGVGFAAEAAQAIDFAVAHGAKVVNASWTLPADPALSAAVGRARDAGVVVVAAAGNDGADLAAEPVYPAAYASQFDNVVAVASTDAADQLAASSDYGAGVALAAPGVGILSTLPGGGYGTLSGTSMAAGFVSGAVALLWGAHPGWTYHQVIDQLESSVDQVPGLAGKVATGGRLDVGRMLDAPPDSPPPPSPSTAPPATAPPAFAVGTTGVTLYNPDGSVRRTFDPFPGSTGGVRVAVGDFNGDGVPDVVAGTGPGTIAEVKVLDGATGAVMFDTRPFADFTGGVYVAAGDVTGDGVPDLVVTPDVSGGPRVQVYRGGGFAELADFWGIADPGFRGGARAAVGDLNGDGFADLIISAGVGGGPRVSVYDGQALAGGGQVHLTPDFFLFEPSLRNGAYVAAGDVDGDGDADLVGGGGPGGGPRVVVVSGRQLLAAGPGAACADPLANFFAGDPTGRTGAAVAVADLDGDGDADVVAAGGSRVTTYAGRGLAAGTAAPALGLDAEPGNTGGVFVG